MDDHVPIDRADRDAITMHLDDSAFVEAGAGTGKSTTLVQRVVAMVVDRGVPIRSIAAITFTERAASELRDKVRAALEQRMAHVPSLAVEAALVEVDAAVIGTIHGFALAILREHAVVAGLPLGFVVVDEGDSRSARRGRARAVVEQLPGALPVLALDILDTGGTDLIALMGLIEALDTATPRIAGAHVVDPSPNESEHLRQEAVRALTVFIGESLAACLDDSDRLAQWIGDRVVQLRDQLDGAETLALTRMLVSYAADWRTVFYPGGIGGKAGWGSSDEAKAVRGRLKECEAQVISAISAPSDYAVRAALAVAWQQLAEARRARATSGELEFDDLLLLTRDLLESPDNLEVRAMVAQRFRAVLVDEFQDTDPVQWRVVQLVTSDPLDESATPQPGRLVVVGDPKQAIYSFRGADITTYLDAQHGFSGAEHKLVTSFRSVSPLVEWFNAVFSELFVAGPFQPTYEELVAFHAPVSTEPAGPTVVVLADPATEPDEKPNEAASRALEPRLVATAIRRAIDDHWQVTAPDSAGTARHYTRGCLYRDVAILVPTRTGVEALLDALDDAASPTRTPRRVRASRRRPRHRRPRRPARTVVGAEEPAVRLRRRRPAAPPSGWRRLADSGAQRQGPRRDRRLGAVVPSRRAQPRSRTTAGRRAPRTGRPLPASRGARPGPARLVRDRLPAHAAGRRPSLAGVRRGRARRLPRPRRHPGKRLVARRPRRARRP
jgi:ATP-dependent helicase/nuclease subunit A